MKVKNIDLIGMVRVLEYYSKKKLPQRISFAITRNMILLAKDIECYSKSLENIFDKYKEYFVKDENGNIKYNNQGIPIVDKEHVSTYGNEIGELLNIEIDVDLYKIDISIFDYDDNDKYDSLSAEDIISLQSVLCDSSYSK